MTTPGQTGHDDRAGATCPACGTAGAGTFHTEPRVPTNSCLLLEDADEAASFPTGRLELAHCTACGFVFNAAFDPGTAEYSQRYEETQAFSPTFTRFGTALAKRWVDEHDLAGGDVLEIGCGKGEFLVWMVEAGVGTATGIDPGVHPERLDGEAASRITWRAETYDASFGPIETDAVVCRHTLEHLPDVHDFLTTLRAGIGDRHDTVLLFELPDTQRVLDEAAFWDTYYEHCSYFTAGSLVRLFRRAGFAVESVERAYDDQYLLLVAHPSDEAVAPTTALPLEDDLEQIADGVAHFADEVAATITRWRDRIAAVAAKGGRTVLWGGGSKAVAFLTTEGLGEDVAGAVDINPHKQGRHIAGTGHRVLAPAELVDLAPTLVIAVNPVYRQEIRDDLDALGLQATELLCLGED